MWFFQCCTPVLSENEFEEIQEPFPLQKSDFGGQPIVNTLSQIWQPLIAKGKVQKRKLSGRNIFKETTLENVDVEDLLATVERTRPDKMQKAGIYWIGSHLLNQSSLGLIAQQIDVSKVFPSQLGQLKKRMLVMYTPENKDQYLFHTPQQSEITIGTVEVMLNSEFTGGELQIISDDRHPIIRFCTYIGDLSVMHHL